MRSFALFSPFWQYRTTKFFKICCGSAGNHLAIIYLNQHFRPIFARVYFQFSSPFKFTHTQQYMIYPNFSAKTSQHFSHVPHINFWLPLHRHAGNDIRKMLKSLNHINQIPCSRCGSAHITELIIRTPVGHIHTQRSEYIEIVTLLTRTFLFLTSNTDAAKDIPFLCDFLCAGMS